jgi:hypothetical protein
MNRNLESFFWRLLFVRNKSLVSNKEPVIRGFTNYPSPADFLVLRPCSIATVIRKEYPKGSDEQEYFFHPKCKPATVVSRIL